MNPLFELGLFLFFLAASAFYSGIETGMVSINRVRLRHLCKKQDKRALHLEEFLTNPDQMLAASLIGNNIVNTALTVIGARLLVNLFDSARLGGIAASFFITLLILVFGEYLPKAWFQSHPLTRSARFVPLFRFSRFLFHGVSQPLLQLVRWVIPGPENTDEAERLARITRRDIQYLLSKESGATPDLGEQRRRMVVGVFALSEKTARDVMVPWDVMLRIKQQTPIPEILELARRTQVKSFPVFSDTDQRFTGILQVRDLLSRIDEPGLRVQDLLRPPQYVDEDLPADDLIPRMRLTRQPMLLVRDVQGKVTGFVTTEVVLEEIVGPLTEG